MKCYDDASNPHQWKDVNTLILKSLKANFKRVVGWGYHFDRTVDPAVSAAAIKSIFELGFDAYVVDAEVETENPSMHPHVDATMKALNVVAPAGCLGFTSFGNRNWHPNVPWDVSR